jgi:alanine-glyoxylate transaminase/serine-glyoxylate transaminase/serine-pyruvate transaminase
MIGKKLLMIPGPIEFDAQVLNAMARATASHVAPEFIKTFGKTIEQMRKVWLCPDGQPFIIAGSGTLAMDMAAVNLIEPGEHALVINTGYFSARMASILKRYGCSVDELSAPLGGRPAVAEVKAALKKQSYKLVTVTHVDTSTGVLADARNYAGAAKEAGSLVVLDGVCSVAGEELRQQEWGIDVAFTASQKAVGVPPGLALLVASPSAIAAFRKRVSPVANYYADWNNWLPVMEAYEAGRPAYFGTPAVNLVEALQVSLTQILAEGMERRFQRHQKMSRAVKQAVSALGLKQVPESEAVAAHTMTAPYYPGGVDSGMLASVQEGGAIFAGGLHPDIKSEYFRIGHMGCSGKEEVLSAVAALEWGLQKSGYRFTPGAGIGAAYAEISSGDPE